MEPNWTILLHIETGLAYDKVSLSRQITQQIVKTHFLISTGPTFNSDLLDVFRAIHFQYWLFFFYVPYVPVAANPRSQTE